MIIDFHTHIFPDAIAPATVKKLGGISHTRAFTDGTAQNLLNSMSRAGIDLSILLPVATRPGQCTSINNFAARINEHNDRLLSLGGIHPNDTDWEEELERMVKLGLKGFKIHPCYQGVDFDDPRYLRLLRRAAELNLIVVTHAGLDIGFPGVNRCNPKMVRRGLDQTGPVKLVAAHMGGWRQWKEVMEYLPETGIYLDTAFSTRSIPELGDGYYRPEELPLLSEEDFLSMVRSFGAHRILFGSDSPWTCQSEGVNWLRKSVLTQKEEKEILGENGKRLLDL